MRLERSKILVHLMAQLIYRGIFAPMSFNPGETSDRMAASEPEVRFLFSRYLGREFAQEFVKYISLLAAARGALRPEIHHEAPNWYRSSSGRRGLSPCARLHRCRESPPISSWPVLTIPHSATSYRKPTTTPPPSRTPLPMPLSMSTPVRPPLPFLFSRIPAHLA
jgi:hypothetical protein